ncbi:YjcQ family protein [Peribacillus butanolivorans]
MNKEKIRIVILRETEKGELFKGVSEDSFSDLGLGFDWSEFNKQVGFLVSEEYLTKPMYASDTISYYNSVVTEKGENFLENNKWHKKGYRTIKEIRDWIK